MFECENSNFFVTAKLIGNLFGIRQLLKLIGGNWCIENTNNLTFLLKRLFYFEKQIKIQNE